MRRIPSNAFLLLALVALGLGVPTASGTVTLLGYGLYKTDPRYGDPASPLIWREPGNLPPGSTTNFTQEDNAAYLRFDFTITVDTNYTVRWVGPDGALYHESSNGVTISRGNSWWAVSTLEIIDHDAAYQPGRWTVQVTINEGRGEVELLKQPFTIAVVYSLHNTGTATMLASTSASSTELAFSNPYWFGVGVGAGIGVILAGAIVAIFIRKRRPHSRTLAQAEGYD